MQLKTLKTILSHPLSRKHRVSTLLRFAKRGIMVRLHKYPMTYPYIGNTQLLVEKGLSSAELQIYTGLYDFVEMSFILHFLDKNDVFADVGANVGVYTVLASGCRGAHSYAFEPIPQTFTRLKNNIALNNLETISNLYNIGLGENPGILSFTATTDAVNHVLANNEKTTKSIAIEVKTLDSVMGATIPSVLKIDVEGFETPVIKGAQQILANPKLKAIIIELNGLANRYGFDESWIHENLTQHGFKPYGYFPVTRTFNQLNTYGNINTLYLRDLPYIENKVKNSPAFEVLGIKI